jgi:hypothetical protein
MFAATEARLAQAVRQVPVNSSVQVLAANDDRNDRRDGEQYPGCSNYWHSRTFGEPGATLFTIVFLTTGALRDPL